MLIKLIVFRKNSKNYEETSKWEDKKEKIIEVTLENGNKFSHRKLSCELPQNIRETPKQRFKNKFYRYFKF